MMFFAQYFVAPAVDDCDEGVRIYANCWIDSDDSRNVHGVAQSFLEPDWRILEVNLVPLHVTRDDFVHLHFLACFDEALEKGAALLIRPWLEDSEPVSPWLEGMLFTEQRIFLSDNDK